MAISWVGSDAGRQKIPRVTLNVAILVKPINRKVPQRDDFWCAETLGHVFCDSLALMHACMRCDAGMHADCNVYLIKRD